MIKILVLSDDKSDALQGVCRSLREGGYACFLAIPGKDVTKLIVEQTPDLVLVESISCYRIAELSRAIKDAVELPIIAVVDGDSLSRVNGHFSMVNDFVARPFQARELELRINRLLGQRKAVETEEELSCGDLKIDLAKCEVWVANRIVLLTFKEYELLKYLVSNQGRVFSRDALLDKVWGYDYYGGDRTVDVHIRRLRSKLEDANHNFIETIRNIGYRFHSGP